MLWRLVSAARKSGKETRIVLSIGTQFFYLSVRASDDPPIVGGWSGSYWFSHATSNDFNRTKLCNAIVGVVHAFGLDGL
jgi:hypothetical protein